MQHPRRYQLKWKSEKLEGKVSGTPVISSNGKFTFVTHNTQDGGYFTILSNENGMILFQESAESVYSSNEYYGPIGISRNPQQSLERFDKNNTNDILVWGPYALENEDLANGGSMFGFQVPKKYSGGKNTSLFMTTRLNFATWNFATWTTKSPPALSSIGDAMYFSILSDENFAILGWADGRRFDKGPSWDFFGDSNQDQNLFTNTPTLNPDETKLFVGSLKKQFYAFDVSNGVLLWERSLDSPTSSKARLSLDGERVYFVESQDGNVVSMNIDGTFNWEYNLNFETLSEFAVSSNNHILYIASTNGTVTALTVAYETSLAPSSPSQPSFSSEPSFDQPHSAANTNFIGLQSEVSLFALIVSVNIFWQLLGLR